MKNLKKIAAMFTSKINDKGLDIISNQEMSEIFGGRPENVMDTNSYWWFEDESSSYNKMVEVAAF